MHDYSLNRNKQVPDTNAEWTGTLNTTRVCLEEIKAPEVGFKDSTAILSRAKQGPTSHNLRYEAVFQDREGGSGMYLPAQGTRC